MKSLLSDSSLAGLYTVLEVKDSLKLLLTINDSLKLLLTIKDSLKLLLAIKVKNTWRLITKKFGNKNNFKS